MDDLSFAEQFISIPKHIQKDKEAKYILEYVEKARKKWPQEIKENKELRGSIAALVQNLNFFERQMRFAAKQVSCLSGISEEKVRENWEKEAQNA